MNRPLVTVKSLVNQARLRGGVELPDDAIITPAARDWLRSTRVPVTRGGAAPVYAPAPDRYVIGDAAQPMVQTLLPGLQRQYAGLKFLPCNGCTSGLMAAVHEACAALSASPECRAAVVVRDGASVSLVANKCAGVQAAILGKPTDLLRLQRELGVNMLILERERTSLTQIRAAIDAFFAGPTSIDPVIAAALQGQPTGAAGGASGRAPAGRGC